MKASPVVGVTARLVTVLLLSSLLLAVVAVGQPAPPHVDAQANTEIAFITFDATGNATGIDSIKPDGSGRRTIWSHPDAGVGVSEIFDVAWSPDATELAFTSSFERLYSPYSADVYGIRPDGSGLRRITNPPLRSDLLAQIQDGTLQTGSVRITLVNNYSDFDAITFFSVYIRGAAEPVLVNNFPAFNQAVVFTVPNVADLGETQQIIAHWSSNQCNLGVEVTGAAPIRVFPDQTGEVTFSFDGSGCNQPNNALDVSWNSDGSNIGFLLSLLPLQTSTSTDPFGPWLNTSAWFPQQPFVVDNPAWSPVDDRIIYDGVGVSPDGVFLIEPGQPTGSLIVPQGFLFIQNPVWLPDGSGLLYIGTNNLYRYDFATQQSTQLTNLTQGSIFSASPSPDGSRIAIGYTNQGINDIFVLDFTDPANPTTIQLTTDGRSSNPAWSRVAPTTPEQTPTPTLTPTDDTAASPTPTDDTAASPTPTDDTAASPTPTDDPAMLPTSQPVDQNSETVTPADGGGPTLDDPDSPVIIDFPAGATTEDLDVTIYDLDSTTMPVGNFAVLRSVRVEARNAFAELVTQFEQPVLIDIEYNPAVAPFQGIAPADMQILVWDGSAWLPLPEAALERDPENNRIAARVQSFSNPNGGTEFALVVPQQPTPTPTDNTAPTDGPAASPTPTIDPLTLDQRVYLPRIVR